MEAGALPAPPPTPTPTNSVEAPAAMSESRQVLSWRLAQLADAGYGDDATAVLAVCEDVDLHRACDLLLHGCREATALRILL